MGDGMELSEYCTAVRPSNALDRMFYLQHRVGAQSNVLVSALYAPTTPGRSRLSRALVYSAIRSVITTYPELGLIAVRKPSKKGHHVLQLAALHEIDLDTCVEFLDDEEPTAGPEVIERLHNEWLWTDEQFNCRQPWWKVVVLGGRQVVFVFHHMICDGRFGQSFHQEFLAALNDSDGAQQDSTRIVKVGPERVRLSKDMEEFWTSRASVLRVLFTFLMLVLVRLFFGRRLFFWDMPKPKQHTPSVLVEASPENRTKTRISTLRIPAARMRRIVAACREQKTSFTPLLIVAVLSTLACDFYPEARVGISQCAIDMRSLYPEDEKSGKLLQCAGGTRKLSWLDNYRRVFGSKSSLDADAAWQLVRDYRAYVSKKFEGKDPELLVVFRASNSVSHDLEGMLASTFPALGLNLNNCFQVSNLGAFSARQEDGPWTIEDMGFSAATVNGNLSYNLNLNIAGVEGGDTVINASYEDGMLPDDMASEIMDGALERIEAIL
ncbi:hypothetical protein ACJ41O_006083 [Fusarium nematophilum]